MYVTNLYVTNKQHHVHVNAHLAINWIKILFLTILIGFWHIYLTTNAASSNFRNFRATSLTLGGGPGSWCYMYVDCSFAWLRDLLLVSEGPESGGRST
jgi:hypothetical protein